MEIKTGFNPIKQFGGSIHQSVMPIVSITNEEITPLGTGFVINPGGLFVTATHVLKDFLSDAESKPPVYAIYTSDKRHSENRDKYVGGPLRIKSVSWSPELDVAYCQLELLASTQDGKPLLLPCFSVSAALPRIDENILGIGYPNSRWDTPEETREGLPIVSCLRNTISTTGNVVEIHYPKRDSTFLYYPCFQTTARFESGMSGGPIINESGFVCGVICRSFGDVADQLGPISYGSLLSPSFAISIKVLLSGEDTERELLVYDLIKRGGIGSDDSIKSLRIIEENGKRSVSIIG
ncbi:MAG: serine protease [Anaerolineales bacterium]